MQNVTLVLHQHPFASYCQKVLIALYELGVPFEPHLVDGAEGRAELARLWPMATIPVLTDGELILPESTTIIEYIDDGTLVPDLQARLWDRFSDQHLSTPMQKIVADTLRPEGRNDPEGVADARRAWLPPTASSTSGWRTGHGRAARRSRSPTAPPSRRCSICARIHRWDDGHANITRYYRDLLARPTITRVVEEARPLRRLFPLPWPPDQDDLGPT